MVFIYQIYLLLLPFCENVLPYSNKTSKNPIGFLYVFQVLTFPPPPHPNCKKPLSVLSPIKKSL